jgi:hypothetical protein
LIGCTTNEWFEIFAFQLNQNACLIPRFRKFFVRLTKKTCCMRWNFGSRRSECASQVKPQLDSVLVFSHATIRGINKQGEKKHGELMRWRGHMLGRPGAVTAALLPCDLCHHT